MTAQTSSSIFERVSLWPRLRHTMLVFFVPFMIAAGVPALGTIVYNFSDISISLANLKPVASEPPKSAPAPAKVEQPQQTPEITPTPIVEAVSVAWDAVRTSNEIEGLYKFAKAYPDSKYTGDAWRRMNALVADGQLKLADLGDEYLDFVGDVLNHKEQTPDIVRRIADDHDLISKYPFGYAIFYADGYKTVHSSVGNQSKYITFDPSSLELTFKDIKSVCLKSLSVFNNGRSVLTGIGLCFGGNGSVIHLVRINHSIELDAEPLGQSQHGVAWVLGMRGL